MEIPSPLDYTSPPAARPLRPLALIGIAATAILAGPIVGVTTNAINGAISPTYFISVLGWQYVADVWWASIEQGFFEGLVVGLIFSTILTLTLGIVTRCTCTYRIGLRFLAALILAVYGLWIICGFMCILLADFQPRFFQNTFIGVPSDRMQMLRYAWVGGSIWGSEVGGLLAVIIGLVIFRINWQRMLKQQDAGN